MACREPHKTIRCQDLMQATTCSHSGWLRRKTRLARWMKMVGTEVMVLWTQSYVVLSEGCVYCFNNEKSKCPSKAFSLQGFIRVMRAGDILHSDVPWAFKLLHGSQDVPVLYFSAASEQEMKTWMQCFKMEMVVANEARRQTSGYVDYHDIESPIVHTKPSDLLMKDIRESLKDADAMDEEGGIYLQLFDVESRPTTVVCESNVMNTPIPDISRPVVPPRKKQLSVKSLSLTEAGEQPDSTKQFRRVVSEPLAQRDEPDGRSSLVRVAEEDRQTCTASASTDDLDPFSNSRTSVTSRTEVKQEFPPNSDGDRTSHTVAVPEAENYWSNVYCHEDKATAKRILSEIGIEGVYLVRVKKDSQEKILHVLSHGEVRKYKIEEVEGQFYIQYTDKFSTLPRMLYHYYFNDLPTIPARLLAPYQLAMQSTRDQSLH